MVFEVFLLKTKFRFDFLSAQQQCLLRWTMYLEVVLEDVGVLLVHDAVGPEEHVVQAPLRNVQQRVHVV